MKGFKLKFKISNRIAAGLADIERARGFLEGSALSGEWVRQMKERALILEAHHTTHIEGTHLTLEQSELILAGGKVAQADPDDVRELLNYREAFKFVSEQLEAGGPVTEGLIREIHKRLVERVRGGAADPGEYRKIQNYVANAATGEIIYTPPPPQDVPGMMAELVEWLNGEHEIHPVLNAGIAQFQLVHIHPFRDGNGRASRLLSALCLYRAGYDFKRLFSISEFYDRDRPAFYQAIQSVRESDMDMTGWLDYFINGLVIQLEEVKEKREQVIRCGELARKHDLSERQVSALKYALEHEDISIRDFEALFPKVSRRTLQRDLKDMVEKGLLSAEGATDQQVYVLNGDMTV